MVVKIYISGISGNKEVKKRQQRVLMILDSKGIKYELIDITEPGRESDKEYMQNNSKSNGGTVSDPNPRSPLPPQMFNDEEYCGDYDQFDLANEIDTLEQFLKLEVPPEEPVQAEPEKEKIVNGDAEEVKEEIKSSNEETQESSATENPTDNGETVVKESTPTKGESPSKEGTPVREATPAEGEVKDTETDDALATGDSEKAESERQKSVEKEASPEKAASPEKELESKKESKENSPEKEVSVNENGTVSSREPSEDRIDETTVETKKDPSEMLIQNEQTAAAE